MKLRSQGAGPAVVKLAGLAGGTGLYREEMGRAVDAGFRVVALDTAGDCQDDPAPGPLTWDLLAAEVFRGLDELGLPQAILWGTSFGCLVALGAAARRPRRVRGLLLCHPPEPLRRPRYERAAFQWAGRRADPGRAAALLLPIGFRLLAGWEVFYPPLLRRLPRLYRSYREAATPGRTIYEKYRLLAEESPGHPPEETLVPVSIIAGNWDTVAPARGALRLSRSLPGASIRTLRFSGHCGAYSRPGGYIGIVLEELRRLSSGEPRPLAGKQQNQVIPAQPSAVPRQPSEESVE